MDTYKGSQASAKTADKNKSYRRTSETVPLRAGNSQKSWVDYPSWLRWGELRLRSCPRKKKLQLAKVDAVCDFKDQQRFKPQKELIFLGERAERVAVYGCAGEVCAGSKSRLI